MASIFDVAPKRQVSVFDPQPSPTGAIGTLEEYGYEVPEEKGWSLLGKKFVNVLTGTLNVLRTGEYAVGGILSGESPITGIREKISPSEVLFKDREEDRKLWSKRGITALAVDILLDPVTYLTFGAGGALKLSTKGGQVLLNKSGQRLMRQVIGKGASEAAARRTMAKVIQQGGEEAAKKYIGKKGLRFMGEVFIPVSKFEAAGKVIGKLPGVGVLNKVGSGFARAFRPFREIDMMPAKVGGKGVYTDFLYKPFERETRQEIFKEIDLVKKTAAKAYKDHGVKVGEEIGFKVEKSVLTGDKFLDDVIEWMGREQKEILEVERATGKKIGEIKGYLRHYLTKEGREFIAKGNDFMGALPKPLKAKLAPAQPRTFLRFTDEAGKTVVGTAKSLGLKKIETVRGLSTALDVADLRTIKDIEGVLKQYGITLRFIAKPTVRRTRLGYFNTAKKEIVIASRQPTFTQVLKTIRHEMTHGGQFQLGGMIEMVETFSKKGKFTLARKVLEATKDAAKLEYKGILKAIPVDEKTLSSYLKTYYKKPTELLAFAAGTMQSNPDLARQLFPGTVKAIERIKGLELFGQIKRYATTGVPAKYAYSTKEGKIVESITATIQEVNDYMKTKYGIKNFFEPDAFKAFAMRKAEHIKYINTHKFLEMAKARFGVRLDKVKTTVVEGGIKLVESTNPQLKGWLLPEPIVKHLDDTMKFLTNEETARGFIKGYDWLLRHWKVHVTGIFPAFHTRNFMGGSFNNWLAGVKAIDNTDAWKILQGSDEIFKTSIGTEYTGKQILDLAERFGVRGQPGIMDVYRQVEEAIEEITASNIKKAGIKVSNAPRFAMEFVEDRLRLPLFINRLKKGYSPAEAAKDVFKFHFDYVPRTGLTPFEQTFMRRLIPFYVWTRHNVPLQIEMMMKQPGKYANLEKLRQSMFGEKEKVEFKYLPEWMKEMLLVPLPWKDDAGRSLWMQLDLPLDDIKYLPISSSGIREIASTLTPFLKYPIERYLNRNFYFGGDIWNPELPREMQTRKTTEAFKHLPNPIKKFLNFREVSYRDWRYPKEKRFIKRYEMDAKKLHFLNSFLGRYYSTLRGVYDEDIPDEWKISRYVGGIPVRPVDIGEEKERRESEQERQATEMLRYLQRHRIIPYKSEEREGQSIFDR